MPEIERVPVPVFVKVNDWTAEELPTDVDGKSPLPTSVPVYEMPFPLRSRDGTAPVGLVVETERVPVRTPPAVGLNVTAIAHCAPTASDVSH